MGNVNDEIENNENNSTKNRGMLMDIIVALIAVIALIVCYFFWGCRYDLPATILAIVVILAGSGLLYMQHRKQDKENKEKAQA